VSGDFSLAQLERIGAIMATLHCLCVHSPAALTDALPQFDANAITDWSGELGAVVPLGLLSSDDLALIARAGEHLRRWVSDSAHQPGRWGPIHGDLHHANILLAGDAVHPIDFDGIMVAPYALDLGTMLYHIHYQGAAAQRALIEGYQRVCPLPAPDHSWLDAALVCSAMGNLAFQVTIPEQRASPLLVRNLRQLVDSFCSSLVAGAPILAR
jgi:Ser/Thr protein kinase RdoA (MazF antagonist)